MATVKPPFQMGMDRKELPMSSLVIQTLRAGTPGSNNLVIPGCKILSATFSDSTKVNISSIEFCNRYTASIVISAKFRIEQQSASSNFQFEWKKLVTKTLMPNPHYATAAESTFSIGAADFLVDAKNICALMIVLYQPSVHFTEFSIDNLKVFVPNPAKNSSDSLTQWILRKADSDVQKRTTAIRDFPSLDKVSLALQKMWALGKKADSVRQNSAQPTRFDIDGCYDINLLTY